MKTLLFICSISICFQGLGQNVEPQPLRIFFLKNSTRFQNTEKIYNDSIIKLAFKKAECEKILVIVFSTSQEVKTDPLISFKRYKKIVDYIIENNLCSPPLYIYYKYEALEKKGSSDLIINDYSFLDIIPLKCSLVIQ